MERIIKSPFEKKEKISLNIDITTLNLVKELAKLTKTNNTLILNTLLIYGLAPLTKSFKTSWLTLLGDTKDKAKKEHLNKLLEELIKISEKEEYRDLITS